MFSPSFAVCNWSSSPPTFSARVSFFNNSSASWWRISASSHSGELQSATSFCFTETSHYALFRVGACPWKHWIHWVQCDVHEEIPRTMHKHHWMLIREIKEHPLAETLWQVPKATGCLHWVVQMLFGFWIRSYVACDIRMIYRYTYNIYIWYDHKITVWSYCVCILCVLVTPHDLWPMDPWACLEVLLRKSLV